MDDKLLRTKGGEDNQLCVLHMCGQRLYISCKHRLACATICCLDLAPLFFFFLFCDIIDGAQDAPCSHLGRIHQRDGKQGGTLWQLLVSGSVIPRERPQSAIVL